MTTLPLARWQGVGPTGPIVLIGPVGAGKTTQGRLVAAALGVPHRDLDEVAWAFYAEAGYTEDAFALRAGRDGFAAAHTWMCPARAYAVERLLAETPSAAVISLGAGHSHLEDPEQFQRVAKALASLEHVILLLPSPNLPRAVEMLRERSVRQRGDEWIRDGYDFIVHWVRDPCNARLATLTVYTEGRAPADTCDDILGALAAREAVRARQPDGG